LLLCLSFTTHIIHKFLLTSLLLSPLHSQCCRPHQSPWQVTNPTPVPISSHYRQTTRHRLPLVPRREDHNWRATFNNIDRRILAEAITGNTRVVSLKLAPAREDDVGMNAFVRALPNSRGLVDLDMSCNAISDEHWRVLCESLMVHPAISTLVICETPPNRRRSRNTMSDAQKACRTRAIADMLQENTILHTIRLSIDEFDSGSYAESIQPGLETNLYRPRVLSIEEIDDSLFRRKVLGRALSLHSVRSKPNLIWMFLSQNVDIACVGGNG
jgi:hypothetical protein